MAYKALIFLFNGMPFFSHILDESFSNLEMVSGLFSAIQMMSLNTSGQSISSISMGNNKINARIVRLTNEQSFLTNPMSYFMIVSVSDSGISDKNVLDALERVEKTFFSIYSRENVMNWNGSLLEFLPFKKVVNRIINLKDDEGIAQISTTFWQEEKGNAKKEAMGFILALDDHPLLEISSLIDNPINFQEIFSMVVEDLRSSYSFTWEGIVPKLKDQQILYVYARRFQSTINNKQIYVIGIYMLNDKFQIFLPKLIPQIQPLINNCIAQYPIEEITNIFENSEHSVSHSIEDLKIGIQKHITEANFIEKIIEKADIQVDLNQFLHLKNCDHLIFALIYGQPIAIFGEINRIHECISQMGIFTPHRSLHIMDHLEKIGDFKDVDIAIINPKNKRKYKDFVLVDLENMVVKNGSQNKFCETLAEDIIHINDSYLISLFVKRKINWLVSKSTLIRDLSLKNSISKQDIALIRGDMDKDTEMIVLRLAEGKNSHLQNLLDLLIGHIPIKQLKLSEKFIDFNDHKVIICGNLHAEELHTFEAVLYKKAEMFLGSRFIENIQRT